MKCNFDSFKDNRSYWFNYVKGEYEYIDTPTDFSNYIPQIPAAQSMYRLLVNNMGETPLKACAKVLEACVGEPK